MIERHVTFQLHPGKAQAFEALFRSRYGPAMARQPGFLGAELLKPEGDHEALVMVLRFVSTSAAQAWRESADHQDLSPSLKSLYARSDVRVHEILAQQPGTGGTS